MNEWSSALYGRLSGGAALCALVGGTASPRIYYMQAPEKATLPYVIFSLQSSVEPSDTAHRIKDALWSVRGYSPNALVAGSIDAEVDALLHMQPLTITGYETLWLAREQDLELVEYPPSGSAVYMQGGFYRATLERSE